MALFKSDVCEYPSLHPPVTASQAGVVFASVGTAAVTTSLAAGDIVLLNRLPAFHQPLDFILETTDLDSHGTPTIAVTVGIANAAMNDLVADTDFITTATTAQTGGILRADVISKGMALAPSTAERYVALKVTTVAETPAAGTIRGKLLYHENPS